MRAKEFINENVLSEATKVVYHGTNNQFSQFDRGTLGTSTGDPNAVLGHFFTSSKREAQLYGKYIISATLRLNNPYEATMDELVGLDEEDYVTMREELIGDGYDGIIAPHDDGPGMWYVVFSADQINIIQPKQKSVNESLRVDVPNEEWLQDAIDYAKQKSPDRNGLPYMGKTTATARHVDVPVSLLKQLPGMRNEQQNVRQEDLAAIMKIMSDTGKLPLHGHSGEEYKPFINVAYDGSAWVNEGNHRIMAAAKLGWPTLPVEISYFDGGERIKSGPIYPGKIGL